MASRLKLKYFAGRAPEMVVVRRPSPKIEFGRPYRDRITGFSGVCTGKSSFISGCDQVLLVPSVDINGGYREGQWFDDERLIDIDSGRAVERTSRRGGPQQTPPVR